MEYKEIYSRNCESQLKGRYITNGHITPLLLKADRLHHVVTVGNSVKGKPIFGYQVGTGKIKILAWSQMHGNESTATKALFDLFNFFESDSQQANNLLSACSFFFIPILNPDGAKAYTRENANLVDLNRDAQLLSQPESMALRKIYDDFAPNYCFNLHDQRTIFGVGNTGNPATLSFLAPSYNESCEVNDIRQSAIDVIAAMDKALQPMIPGCVGRFDDSFNSNCVGDAFQMRGTPTILLEAGHHAGDYNREFSRQYVFIALLAGFTAIYENVIVGNDYEYYMHIPQNNPNFFDLVYKNISINYDNSEIITNFAAQYTEELVGKQIDFKAFIVKIGDLTTFSGHYIFDAEARKYRDGMQDIPIEGQPATFLLGEDIRIVNGMVTRY